MQKLVSELSGAELDYWVGMAENLSIELGKECTLLVSDDLYFAPYNPSSNPLQGYPIIEIARININSRVLPTRNIAIDKIDWRADIQGNYGMTGETALIAAMRCKVASVYGEYVTID